MQPTPTVKFALYIRASTEEQQITLTAQEERERKYVLGHDGEAHGPFVDSGVSGGVPFFERPAVGQMLEAMQREGITDLVMTSLDRGFRNTMDCLNTFAELQKRGIHIHILNINLDTRSPYGKFFLTLIAAVAELENGVRSIRQKDAFASMRRGAQKCGKQVPFGWDVPPVTIHQSPVTPGTQNGALIPNPVEQAILARLVHGDLSAAAGCSLGDARRALNNEGAKTKNAGQTMTRQGKTWIIEGKWTECAIQSVLKNPRLAPGYEVTGSARVAMDLAA